ncbi:NAD(P)-binding protein [Aulographum hederae CBS 113979]|uniref:NAD(P)-binding protein n=1 Tax=Aulographum hederae CBS 113979 TaxID=1176131 RepID=A0A6G1H7C9_9PEZI|nr:NAD(P)-binding protein [Aulographum hederae CBS 113979]
MPADQRKYINKLEGAKVLIFGGSSGIGFGVAEAVLEYGASVTISSSSQQRIDDAVARLKKSYPSCEGKIVGYTCNLGDEATAEENIKSVLEKVGTVDHIVYTAGDALGSKPLSEQTFEMIKQRGVVRFFSPLLLAKHAPSHLSAGPRASITLTTGTVGEKPIAGWGAGAAYASGMIGMAKSLALDLKPIRVNVVSPGAVETELWDSIPQQARQKLFEHLESAMLTGRVGRVQDVVEAYLFAMKDENATGGLIQTNSGGLIG